MTSMWATMKENYQMYLTAAENGKTGATATLTLNLKNQNAPVMWSCVVALPEGVTYVDGSIAAAGSRYPEGYAPTFSATTNADGTVTFQCWSANEDEVLALTNTDGVVATIEVAVASDVTPGDFTVAVNTSSITDNGGTVWTWEKANELNWTIEEGATPGIIGDVNHDGVVDIADAVTILNAMAADTYDAAFDVNKDGEVDIADYVTVLNIMAAQPS